MADFGNNSTTSRVPSEQTRSGRPEDLTPLAELVEAHYDGLYRYAVRLSGSAADADDLVQQTFLTAQQKLDQVRDPAHVRAWLYTIVRNTFLKQRRHASSSEVSLDAIEEPRSQPVELEVDGEQLQAYLDELPEEFRTPLVLFYFQEFSYREIAQHLSVPIGTVMSRLSRARRHLRAQFQAPEDAEADGGAE